MTREEMLCSLQAAFFGKKGLECQALISAGLYKRDHQAQQGFCSVFTV